MPKVSILTPAYNAQDYIGATIDSILRQTFIDFEYIILDDCSTDNTYSIIQKYAEIDSRIKVIRNEKNLGIAGSRNRLVSLSVGEYLAWQDADDISLPYRIKKQVELLDSDSSLGIIGGGLQFFNDEIGDISQRLYATDDATLRKKIFRYSPVAQPSAMIRRIALETAGEYDLSMPPSEDLDMSFRIGMNYKFGNVSEILVRYRDHENSATYTKLRIIEKNTVSMRFKYAKNQAYSMTILDRFYSYAQYISMFLIPAKLKIKLFNFIRNTDNQGSGKDKKEFLIGFIGQGWIGKNYANNFEERGYKTVRYGIEPEYVNNKEKIKDCDIVFIAVPTPTTKDGFDDGIVRSVMKLIGKGKIAIIKSTIIPGTTESIQKENPDIYVMHSPEFLREVTAAYDAAHPSRNIIGIPDMSMEYFNRAEMVISVLPESKFQRIMDARSAEMVKYISNCFLTTKVVFFNIAYDIAQKMGLSYEDIRLGVAADSRIGESHTSVLHASGHNQDKPGRGAGGHCFIKDFEAYMNMYDEIIGSDVGGGVLHAIRDKNFELLRESEKDTDLLKTII